MRRLAGALALVLVVGAAVWHWGAPASITAGNPDVAAIRTPPARPPAARAITARGRLQPRHRVIKVAGPSQPATSISVISELHVKEGDAVTAGDVIAIFDSHRSQQATVARLRAELQEARREHRRFESLYEKGVVSAAERDAWQTKVTVKRAELEGAEAALEHVFVRVPISGRVLKIHAYPGERVGFDGVVELGATDQMYAVAEVYESDIGGVRVGQRATITSPALPEEFGGTVEHIGWQVAKMDVLAADPAAKTDARVIEVKVRLEDSIPLAHLTGLQVAVRIMP